MDESLLVGLELLAADSQGIVYSAPSVDLPYAPSFVYKQYRPEALTGLDAATLQAMVGHLEALPTAQRTALLSMAAWPCQLVEHGGAVTGLVMPAIPGQFFVAMRQGSQRQLVPAELERLLTGESFLARHGIPLTDRLRYQLIAATADMLTFLHGQGIAVGDLSASKLLYSLGPAPGVYVVGGDAMRFQGASALPQSESPQWEVRRLNPREELGTPESDSHKLGLLALRLLVGNQSVRDSDRLLSSVPTDVRCLIDRSLSSDPSARPVPADWPVALRTAADQASTRLPTAPKSRSEAAASTPVSSVAAARPPGSPTRPTTPSPRAVAGTAAARAADSWSTRWQRRSPAEKVGMATGALVVLGLLGGLGTAVIRDGRPAPGATSVEPAQDTAGDPSGGPAWSRLPHDESVFGGPGEQAMQSVAVGGPGLVAVGYDDAVVGEGAAAVWTSEDGQTWSRVPHDEAVFGGDGDQWMTSVAVGGPGLVAVGIDAEREAPVVWTSEDGQTWSRIPHDEAVFGGDGTAMFAVVAGGPGLVAVGTERVGEGAAAVWTSEDGQTWVRAPHDETVFGGAGDQVMRSVAAGGPGLVAVGHDDEGEGAAAVWTSEDGRTWSRVPHDEAVFGGFGEQWMTSVAAGGPGVVAVGTDAEREVAAVWTSSDGQTWSRVPHDPTAFGGGGGHLMISVVAGGPGLVAVGTDFAGAGGGTAAVWTSSDGHTWSRAPHRVFGSAPSQRMFSVVEGGPGLVAVGDIASGLDGAAAVWIGE